MKRLALAVLVFCCWGKAALAADLTGDVQAYVDRRAACNYWPFEKAGKDKIRKAEIEHHLRNLHCDTLAREEALLEARYHGDAAVLQAIADAHDALPD